MSARSPNVMKTTTRLLGLLCALGLAATASAQSSSSNTASASARVGVYDSRVLAYAWFWSEPAAKERNARIAEAKVAKASGDTARAKELGDQLAALQLNNHLQVFSTAPVDDILAALGPKFVSLKAELGVGRFVSKWDEAALKAVPTAERIDVTDPLTRAIFTPTERQVKTIEAIKAQPPIPLEQARKLAQSGEL